MSHEIKLTYFDFPGGRGEDCRIALHIGGVAFTDDRIKGSDWGERKPSSPYGSLPILTIDGHEIAQSNAILGLIGAQHGLLPENKIERAQHIALLNAVEDLRKDLGPSLGIKDPDEKKTAREAAIEKKILPWAGRIERQVSDEGPFFGGAELSVADLKLFVVMNWLNGVLDHIPTTVIDDFPKMNRLHAAVKSHDGVVSWYAK